MNRLSASWSLLPSLPFSLQRRWLLVLALAAAGLAVGCSPQYDWRQIRADEDGYVAMMPGKPDRMTRSINLDGMKVSMTMQGARVGELAFTVATSELPDTSVATRERAVAAMRAAMVRNIAGRETAAQALAVPVGDGSDRVIGTAPGWQIDAVGHAGGREVEMHAIFTARNGRAWQAVVLGPAPDPEQTKQFLDGFRLTN